MVLGPCESLGEQYPGVERFRCVLGPKVPSTERAAECELRYEELDPAQLSKLGPLLEALNLHHQRVTIGWKEYFGRFTFQERCRRLTRTGKELRIDVVRAADEGRVVGYCISSVSAQRRGEIESLYVAPECRQRGAATVLMVRALKWIESAGISDITIRVAVGNEEVLPFYRRFGFQPRTYHLERLPAQPERR